ncbi:hypothetical protein AB0K00_21805 [Dactylosporangium sp. NPDC049525]|uniref:hypothetical protein n=1 Tax=Dactylosporangium sp. NPDC049525 TaxID=3154730 RepID=UPI0034436462
MGRQTRPAAWAASMFGTELATALMTSIPAAIHAAVRRQMDGHDVVGLSSRHAFGGGWPARYEELATHLGEIPDAHVVRPFGKSYHVVLVNNVVILPVEYAKDLATAYDSPQALRKINKTTLELARQFGPEPSHTQPVLDGFDLGSDVIDTAPDLLRGIQPTGIVIVYYAAHERQGLLNIGWGQVSVSTDATAQWVTAQPLPLPSATPIPGLRVVTSVRAETPTHRFDQAEMGAPLVKPRTAAERAGLIPPGNQPDQQRGDVQD